MLWSGIKLFFFETNLKSYKLVELIAVCMTAESGRPHYVVFT